MGTNNTKHVNNTIVIKDSKQEMIKRVETDEPEEIFGKAVNVTKESQEIANRCLITMEKTRNVGFDTVDKLEEQGQQIRRMETDIGAIQHNMQKSDRKLRAINSLGGVLANKFTNSSENTNFMESKRKLDKKYQKKPMDEPQNNKIISNKRNDMKNLLNTSGTTSINENKLKREVDQLDNLMDQMDGAADDLYRLSVIMGNHIDEHNERLDKISPTMTKINAKLDNSNNKCRSITG